MSHGIGEIIDRRNIQEILHFTTNRGFVGCLAAGAVLSRNLLPEEKLLGHILTLNAPFRVETEEWFDRTQDWIAFVNLSISEITRNLFKHSLKWHADKDVTWVIMSFDPLILVHNGVFFSTTNNIYPLTKRAVGAEGLEALFAPAIPRKAGWTANRQGRPAHLPTCEQAEVLYPERLSMEYLRRVYVRDGDDSDWVHATLRTYYREDVDVVISEKKFYGAPN